ncbi:hypothetical protein EB796_010455 [Bugula neritina]|uniref:THAP-type domain-containing protein n=1 Tax=Bugula neritina TaxID=10212 RepID=A0A7J7JXU3_BUGNE|nr:hypothetical protein EB796_010455 [Bugula neritina]
MVSSCCVRGCTEKFVKGGGVSYFRISSKPEVQRNAWILALKRQGWIPKPHHRICSRHFVTGTWNSDPNHIDYIPTRGMNKEDEMSDAALNDDSLDMSLMDSESTLNHTAGSPVTATSIETTVLVQSPPTPDYPT